jgi:peroxiredoxin
LYEKYHDKGLVVLGVNVADSRKIALDYLKENKVTFPIILDISAAGRKAMGRYLALEDLGADPMTYVIGRDGKIVDGWFGYDGDRTKAAVEKLGL